MKAAIITQNSRDAKRVFPEAMRQTLAQRYELCDTVLCKKNLAEHADFARETTYLFATWGMERFTPEEIKRYFPNLKCLFYAAGSVQGFAREFLDCGVRVFSAWRANAIPVVEYTYAQIILAAKGFYHAERYARRSYYKAARYSDKCGGNYGAKIGLIGVGSIGGMVAEKLRANDVEVLYYDPFLPAERAAELGIRAAELTEIFSVCDVISNHLANKAELTGILSGQLFEKMKPYATFINTGRGKQVDEKGLARAMKKVKTRTALLDVTTHEPLSPFSRLARCRNVIVTPHIAGSNGREVVRMAQFMAEEAERAENGLPPRHEVLADMLATMA